MRTEEAIRDHLEMALNLALKAEHNLLAYIIEMALLELAETEVQEAISSLKVETADYQA
ncbi:hypothetical protein HGP17_27020 [Rhizobium sp. P38BS-XIX]|uniref:hypothetical protein n=1 Tax=Rhizobium sp. P38BS-XIX TaxID=2726740 RepID=UPI001457502D|nr:hypothetical protein [Rhizobium sp. P38BS-XIX]NLS00497.1 hypothetical protein [Rhizobium sp. P38BS-XIX]